MPTTEERRAALEAVAYGDDPQVRPTDRLKALEMLEMLEDDGECWACRRREEQDAEAERVRREDPEQGRRIAEFLLELGGFPLVARGMLRELEGTAGAEPAVDLLAEAARRGAKELMELQQVEVEIERRAQERFEALVGEHDAKAGEDTEASEADPSTRPLEEWEYPLSVVVEKRWDDREQSLLSRRRSRR